MKKSIYLFAFLILLATILTLASCASPETTIPSIESTTKTDGDTPSATEGIVILDGGKSDFQVTYPMNATRKADTGKQFASALTSMPSRYQVPSI